MSQTTGGVMGDEQLPMRDIELEELTPKSPERRLEDGKSHLRALSCTNESSEEITTLLHDFLSEISQSEKRIKLEDIHLNFILSEPFLKVVRMFRNRVDEDGLNLLLHTCLNGNIKLVIILLEENFDVNYCDRYGNTCLHYACFNNDIKLYHFLKEKGAVEKENCLKMLPKEYTKQKFDERFCGEVTLQDRKLERKFKSKKKKQKSFLNDDLKLSMYNQKRVITYKRVEKKFSHKIYGKDFRNITSPLVSGYWSKFRLYQYFLTLLYIVATALNERVLFLEALGFICGIFGKISFIYFWIYCFIDIFISFILNLIAFLPFVIFRKYTFSVFGFTVAILKLKNIMKIKYVLNYTLICIAIWCLYQYVPIEEHTIKCESGISFANTLEYMYHDVKEYFNGTAPIDSGLSSCSNTTFMKSFYMLVVLFLIDLVVFLMYFIFFDNSVIGHLKIDFKKMNKWFGNYFSTFKFPIPNIFSLNNHSIYLDFLFELTQVSFVPDLRFTSYFYDCSPFQCGLFLGHVKLTKKAKSKSSPLNFKFATLVYWFHYMIIGVVAITIVYLLFCVVVLDTFNEIITINFYFYIGSIVAFLVIMVLLVLIYDSFTIQWSYVRAILDPLLSTNYKQGKKSKMKMFFVQWVETYLYIIEMIIYLFLTIFSCCLCCKDDNELKRTLGSYAYHVIEMIYLQLKQVQKKRKKEEAEQKMRKKKIEPPKKVKKMVISKGMLIFVQRALKFINHLCSKISHMEDFLVFKNNQFNLGSQLSKVMLLDSEENIKTLCSTCKKILESDLRIYKIKGEDKDSKKKECLNSLSKLSTRFHYIYLSKRNFTNIFNIILFNFRKHFLYFKCVLMLLAFLSLFQKFYNMFLEFFIVLLYFIYIIFTSIIEWLVAKDHSFFHYLFINEGFGLFRIVLSVGIWWSIIVFSSTFGNTLVLSTLIGSNSTYLDFQCLSTNQTVHNHTSALIQGLFLKDEFYQSCKFVGGHEMFFFLAFILLFSRFIVGVKKEKSKILSDMMQNCKKIISRTGFQIPDVKFSPLKIIVWVENDLTLDCLLNILFLKEKCIKKCSYFRNNITNNFEIGFFHSIINAERGIEQSPGKLNKQRKRSWFVDALPLVRYIVYYFFFFYFWIYELFATSVVSELDPILFNKEPSSIDYVMGFLVFMTVGIISGIVIYMFNQMMETNQTKFFSVELSKLENKGMVKEEKLSERRFNVLSVLQYYYNSIYFILFTRKSYAVKMDYKTMKEIKRNYEKLFYQMKSNEFYYLNLMRRYVFENKDESVLGGKLSELLHLFSFTELLGNDFGRLCHIKSLGKQDDFYKLICHKFGLKFFSFLEKYRNITVVQSSDEEDEFTFTESDGSVGSDSEDDIGSASSHSSIEELMIELEDTQEFSAYEYELKNYYGLKIATCEGCKGLRVCYTAEPCNHILCEKCLVEGEKCKVCVESFDQKWKEKRKSCSVLEGFNEEYLKKNYIKCGYCYQTGQFLIKKSDINEYTKCSYCKQTTCNHCFNLIKNDENACSCGLAIHIAVKDSSSKTGLRVHKKRCSIN